MNSIVSPDGRRYLIAVGSPMTPGMPMLERVAPDIQRIEQLFCSPAQGYSRVLASKISVGASAPDIRAAIYQWFTDPDRRSSDIVLMYFAGHGGDAGRAGRYYLFTSDTNDNKLSETAINVAEFLEQLFEGSGERPQNLLLVLDSCYSGKGGGQSIASLSRIRESGFFREGAGLWFVASADPLTEAGDGAFVKALEGVMADPAWVPHGGSRYLNPLDLLVVAVNAHFDREGFPQAAEGDVFGHRQAHRFIRNPHYTSQRDGVPLVDEAHWDPKGRGVEGMASTGWYFTGRQTALRELTAWLESPASDRRARVVTGAPGSGKSAVLARLVLSAHHVKRAEMIACNMLDPLDGTAPAVGKLQAYAHARGLSTSDIAISLAHQLGSAKETLDGLLHHLALAAGPVGIIVDALDESADPLDTETNLLRPLADASAVRLIVGSRRRGKAIPLAGAATELDLDGERYFSPADMIAYVWRRLVEWDPPTVYRDPARHEDATRLARHVGERAGVSFLFSRLVSRALANLPTAIDTSIANWQLRIAVPQDLHQAFEFDLQRFPREARTRILDLLVPLAYARGKGMPQKNLWVTAASKIAGKEYGNGDIRDALSIAGYYVIQDTDQDEVVYRLFHQEFADYLKLLTKDQRIETLMVDALVEVATNRHDGSVWERLHDPYTRRHLADHAAAAGVLDQFIEEPEFLIHMPPEGILPYLHGLVSRAALRNADMYRKVSHHMRAASVSERASYLHLAALQAGMGDVAQAIFNANQAYRWRARWALWRKAVPGEVAIESEQPVSAISLREIDTDRSVVALGVNGAVHLWALPGQGFLGASESFEGVVSHIFVLDANDQKWVIGVWTPGSMSDKGQTTKIRVLDYLSLKIHAETSSGSSYRPGAACAEVVNGEAMLALAMDENVQIWSVPSLGPTWVVPKNHLTDIRCMALAECPSGPVLVASFDSCSMGTYCDEGILTRMWSAPQLDSMADHYFRSRGSASSMSAFKMMNEQFIAIGYLAPAFVEVLNTGSLKQGLLLNGGSRFQLAGVVEQVDGVLICGDQYGKFCFAQLRQDARGQLSGNTVHTSIEMQGQMLTAPTRVHGRAVVASVYDACQIRLWDVNEMLVAQGPNEGSVSEAQFLFALDSDTISAAAFDVSCGFVFTGTTAGRISAVSASTGAPCWAVEGSSVGHVQDMALGTIDKASVLVVAGWSGDIRLLNASNGQLLKQRISLDGHICSIDTALIDGVPLCFVAVNLENKYSVRIFDLRTGKERSRVGAPPEQDSANHIGISGYDEKTIEVIKIVLGDEDSESLILIAGPYSFVRKLRWPGPNRGRPTDLEMDERVPNSYVNSLTTGVLANRRVAVAGNELGLLVAWDLETSEQLHRVESAHSGSISALLVADQLSSGSVVSGGSGSVRLWSSDLRQRLEIDLETRVVALGLVGMDAIFVATHKGLAVVELGTHSGR